MTRPRLTIAGGGTAALEALLGARKELGAAVELCLLAPEREFRYRPIDPDAPLRPARERGLRIAELVAEVGAQWVVDRAAVVDDAQGIVLTRDGDTVRFDRLLVAAGGRAQRTLRCGDVWQRGSDPGFLDEILGRLRARQIRRVAVVVPRGARWSVPACELALVLAWSTAGSGGSVTLITAEEAPLAALGGAVVDAVTAELRAAGVEVLAGVEAVDDPDDPGGAGGHRSMNGHGEAARVVLLAEDPATLAGALSGRPADLDAARVARGSRTAYDRLISLPAMSGPGIEGLATDPSGFIQVDASLRMRGSESVWAAGACVAATLEHSALAARQADAAIAAIAGEIIGSNGHGATRPGVTELHGMLLTGQRDAWLAENPVGTREPSTRCLWWPPGRAVGTVLAEQIAAWDPAIENALPNLPQGLSIEAAVSLDSGPATPHPVDWGSEEDRRRDVEARQRRALERRAHDADAELRALEDRLDTLAARQKDSIRDLQRNGYLRGR